MFAVALTVLIMAMAVAIDFSRYVMVSEKLKTATDSAALAASLTATRYVRVEIDPGSQEDICCDSEGKCRRCCKDCGESFQVEGSEDALIGSRGYKKYCCSCGCGSVQILERWVKYENNGAGARTAAQVYFDLNKPAEMDTAGGGEARVTSVDVYNNRSSPLYPSAVVRARGKIKTLMLNFMDKLYPDTNLSGLESSRCSQGGTYYYDVGGQRHRAAASIEGCQ
jgi:hypothetical protein